MPSSPRSATRHCPSAATDSDVPPSSVVAFPVRVLTAQMCRSLARSRYWTMKTLPSRLNALPSEIPRMRTWATLRPLTVSWMAKDSSWLSGEWSCSATKPQRGDTSPGRYGPAGTSACHSRRSCKSTPRTCHVFGCAPFTTATKYRPSSLYPRLGQIAASARNWSVSRPVTQSSRRTGPATACSAAGKIAMRLAPVMSTPLRSCITSQRGSSGSIAYSPAATAVSATRSKPHRNRGPRCRQSVIDRIIKAPGIQG